MVNSTDILNARILIVDDQESNVQLLEQMLREVGYRHLAWTLDPYAVCELHRANHYDLILLELQMPGMDGLQVMQGLKDIDTNGYAPILVMTAHADHKLRALATGAKDFISKPFDLMEAKIRIHNILEARLLFKELQHQKQLLEKALRERTADLRDSEARFQRLAELASDWYWEQDPDGHFTKIYGPALEMLGISADAGASEIQHPQHVLWDDEHTALQSNMAARRPFLDFVYGRTSVDGVQQYFQVSGEPMIDAAGRFSGYRGVGKDVTALMCGLVRPHSA